MSCHLQPLAYSFLMCGETCAALIGTTKHVSSAPRIKACNLSHILLGHFSTPIFKCQPLKIQIGGGSKPGLSDLEIILLSSHILEAKLTQL